MSGVHDVLIVGAGSAGCVLADRLSARGLRVVLVEAGSDLRAGNIPESISGESFFAALAEPGRVWPNLTATRTAEQSPDTYLRGRGVGGSSVVNAMIGLWGEVDDYDSWERDHGCSGWGWASVEKYFRRIEVPLRRADHVDVTRVGGALIETCLTNGWAQHRGPFPLAAIPADVGPALLTRDPSGRRVSVVDAYLERARRRGGVDVVCDTIVDRVIIEGGRARGVVSADGREFGARSVVVCAGAIHSPAILMRSGVRRSGVGENLRDHASVPFTMRLAHHLDAASLPIGAVARFSSGRLPADLQLLPIDHHGAPRDADGVQYGSLNLALMSVRSTGRVTVSSSDPLVDPTVSFEMLSDDGDVEALVAGVSTVRRLVASRHFASVAEEIFVDDEGTTLDALPDDPASVTSWARRHMGDYVHASGTCAMGPRDADASVVDPECAVIGVDGLRVCDASIFPDLPRANTHFPVMMAAEHLADRW